MFPFAPKQSVRRAPGSTRRKTRAMLEILEGRTVPSGVYFEDFNTGPNGWGGDGAVYRSSGGVGDSGYIEAHRFDNSPAFNVVADPAKSAATGNLEALYGSEISISYDARALQGGNVGPRHAFYSTGFATLWQSTVAPSIDPFKAGWSPISFEINTNWTDAEAVANGWTRVLGTESWSTTLHHVQSQEVFAGIDFGPTVHEIITGLDDFRMVSAGDHLVVTSPPLTSVLVGNKFDVQISAEDATGNVDQGFTGPVTIALSNTGSNPGGGALGGTLTVAAVNGVADFPDLTINRPGTGYTLQATSDAAVSVTTDPFDVARAVPTVTVSDAGGVYNGSPLPATAAIQGSDSPPAATLENASLTLDYLRVNPDQSLTDLGSAAPLSAGTYIVKASFPGSLDYTPASASTTFTIAPAPLTVTANNQTIVYAQPLPTLGGTLSGVVAGDNITATFSTTATSTSAVGDYGITPMLHDPNGRLANYVVTQKNGTLTIQHIALEPDPVYAGHQALFLGGSAGDDDINITAKNHSTVIVVNMQGEGGDAGGNSGRHGSFKTKVQFNASAIDRIVVYGGAGDDTIMIDRSVTVPALVFAGDGDNYLQAGGGPTVLVGGAGYNYLLAGSANDILIGGAGKDYLLGSRGNDILIGGTTAFDSNAVALIGLLKEWSRTDESYLQSVANLSGSTVDSVSPNGDGQNGSFVLTSSTVHDDGVGNYLIGGSGLDWFLANVDGVGNNGKKDRVRDLRPNEIVTLITL
jgi:MBG domain (YGX type)/RTX calcium-binding nonapeptide repeat (4 copies)